MFSTQQCEPKARKAASTVFEAVCANEIKVNKTEIGFRQRSAENIRNLSLFRGFISIVLKALCTNMLTSLKQY